MCAKKEQERKEYMEESALQFIFILILLAINAFFAASEIAVISLNENRIRKMAEEGNKTANRLVKLVEEPSKFLATIQVGIFFYQANGDAFVRWNH
jgi:CBS domain containing-hemolysin-like protein